MTSCTRVSCCAVWMAEANALWVLEMWYGFFAEQGRSRRILLCSGLR